MWLRLIEESYNQTTHTNTNLIHNYYNKEGNVRQNADCYCKHDDDA